MSQRTRPLPRRSCLSVPASSQKMMAKAAGLPADMVFLDLEDAVAPLEKEGARAKAVDAIKNHEWGEKVLCVRINSWDTKWTTFDVIEVVGNAGERLDEVMLPKVESAAHVVALDLLLNQVEIRAGLPRGHIGIEAQIETARGLINVEEICAASPRLETVILGPVDFSASMGMPSLAGGLAIPEYPGDYFHYVFMKILMAGRANGLQVIDGPYVRIQDLDGFREFSRRTQILGFDGKWALHPSQLSILNEMFAPSQAQFDRAWAILDAYLVATEGDGPKSERTGSAPAESAQPESAQPESGRRVPERRGAVMFGDEMIDEASRKVAAKVVALGERVGLVHSPVTPQ